MAQRAPLPKAYEWSCGRRSAQRPAMTLEARGLQPFAYGLPSIERVPLRATASVGFHVRISVYLAVPRQQLLQALLINRLEEWGVGPAP